MATEVISRAEARAKGLKRYFTGKPCCRSHLAERVTNNKMCVECHRYYQRGYYKKNVESEKARTRATYKKDPERGIAYQRDYREKNPEKIRDMGRTYYEKNSDKIRTRNQSYYERNSEKLKALCLEWARLNPLKKRTYSSNRSARKRAAGGAHTDQDILEILKLQRHKCAYCRSGLKDKYHVDHIWPVIRGGTNDRRNLQVLCRPCNLKKHASDPMDFARRLGNLL